MRALPMMVVALATALSACDGGNGPGPGTDPNVICPDGECPATELTINSTFNGESVDCVVFQDGLEFARTNQPVEIEPNSTSEYTVGDPSSEPTSDGVPTHMLGNDFRIACPPISAHGDIGESLSEECVMNYVFVAEISSASPCQLDGYLWDANAPDHKGELWSTNFGSGTIDVTSDGMLHTNVFDDILYTGDDIRTRGDELVYSPDDLANTISIVNTEISTTSMSFTIVNPDLGIIEAYCPFADFY